MFAQAETLLAVPEGVKQLHESSSVAGRDLSTPKKKFDYRAISAVAGASDHVIGATHSGMRQTKRLRNSKNKLLEKNVREISPVILIKVHISHITRICPSRALYRLRCVLKDHFALVRQTSL